jgi:hypothetical protein
VALLEVPHQPKRLCLKQVLMHLIWVHGVIKQEAE